MNEVNLKFDNKKVAENLLKRVADKAGISIGGGGNISVNGYEAAAISISGATFNFDSDTKLAKFVISDSGEPKLSANLNITPSNLVFNDDTPQTVTVNHLGDGIISWKLFNDIAEIKQTSNSGYQIVPKALFKPESSDLFWKLSETAEYYPANKGISLTNNNSIKNIFLFHFNDDVVDECGNSWNVEGTPTYTEGVFGNAVTKTSDPAVLKLIPASDIKFGNANFTLDFWSKIISAAYKSYGLRLTAGSYIFTFYQSIQGGNTLTLTTPNKKFETAIDGNSSFTHSALVYQHSLQKLSYFQNGINKLDWDVSIPELTVSSIEVCSNSPTRNSILDELHLAASAIWTSNFEPPTEPYTV